MSPFANTHFEFSYPSPIIPAQSRLLVDRLIHQFMRDVGNFAEARAKNYAPRRSGNLQRNIARTPVRRQGGKWIVSGIAVGYGAPYAKWVEAGTGIWGPHRTPILPKQGNFLRFKAFDPKKRPGKRPFLFRHSVLGQVPQRFMLKAYMDTNRLYVPTRTQVLKNQIARALSSGRIRP